MTKKNQEFVDKPFPTGTSDAVLQKIQTLAMDQSFSAVEVRYDRQEDKFFLRLWPAK